MRRDFSLRKAFDDGWRAFSDNAGPAIVATLVWVLVYGLTGATRILPLIFGGPLLGGYAYFSLRLLRGGKPGVGDTFYGFNQFLRFLGIYWLLFLVGFLASLPALAGFGIDLAIQSAGTEGFTMHDYRPGVLSSVGGLATLAIGIYLLTGFAFSYLVSADGRDGGSAFGALALSAEMARGRRIRLFGSFLLLAVFAALGLLIFVIGVVLTVPVSAAAFASIYEQLSAEKEIGPR